MANDSQTKTKSCENPDFILKLNLVFQLLMHVLGTGSSNHRKLRSRYRELQLNLHGAPIKDAIYIGRYYPISN